MTQLSHCSRTIDIVSELFHYLSFPFHHNIADLVIIYIFCCKYIYLFIYYLNKFSEILSFHFISFHSIYQQLLLIIRPLLHKQLTHWTLLVPRAIRWSMMNTQWIDRIVTNRLMQRLSCIDIENWFHAICHISSAEAICHRTPATAHHLAQRWTHLDDFIRDMLACSLLDPFKQLQITDRML